MVAHSRRHPAGDDRARYVGCKRAARSAPTSVTLCNRRPADFGMFSYPLGYPKNACLAIYADRTRISELETYPYIMCRPSWRVPSARPDISASTFFQYSQFRQRLCFCSAPAMTRGNFLVAFAIGSPIASSLRYRRIFMLEDDLGSFHLSPPPHHRSHRHPARHRRP